MTGAASFRKRLCVDEDFLTTVGGFDEAESAVVVPGFKGSGGLHGEVHQQNCERKSKFEPVRIEFFAPLKIAKYLARFGHKNLNAVPRYSARAAP